MAKKKGIVKQVEVSWAYRPAKKWRYRSAERGLVWWWRTVAHNGRILGRSQMHPKRACLKTAKKVAKQLGVPLIVKE